MNLKFIHPKKELAPYVDKIWVFESKYGIPSEDLKTSVPNGMMKIIIPYKGKLVSYGKSNPAVTCLEHSISIIGVMENPVVIEAQSNIGTIGIEIKTSAAYRFFPLPLKSIVNSVLNIEELFGRGGRELCEKVSEASSTEDKVSQVQDFLIYQLTQTEASWITEYAVNKINEAAGVLPINQLCKKLGYSRRYVDLLFAENVGISPKKLSGIKRFQKFYNNKIKLNPVKNFYEENMYDYYFDQTHFIKEFKRFTGFTPKAYSKIANEFGEIFYK